MSTSQRLLIPAVAAAALAIITAAIIAHWGLAGAAALVAFLLALVVIGGLAAMGAPATRCARAVRKPRVLVMPEPTRNPTQEDRERAILVLASRGRIQRLNEDDIEALVDLIADEDSKTLSELLRRPMATTGDRQ